MAAPTLQDLGLAVKRLQWQHHREANKRLAPLKLSLAQWDVLRQLQRHPDASLHALAELTFQTDQSAGALVARMVARGLLERRDGAGRAVRHRITVEGELARRLGADAMDSVLRESIGTLSKAEQGTLHALLEKATASTVS